MRFGMLLVFCALAAQAQTYDIVLRGGRVMDPESGLDAIRQVGIRGKKIAAVSKSPLRGKVEIDAAGLVVAPGFIDLHSHGQTTENYRYKARDGVTTALEMEVGVWPVASWYGQREGRTLIHYGATAGHIPARMAAMKDSGVFLPRDEAVNRVATPGERQAILEGLRKGLAEGGLGVGLGLDYNPTADAEEILEIFRLAAEARRPCFVHMRHSLGVVGSLHEVIGHALASGASLHIVHINSSSTKRTPLALDIITAARRRGLDVTTEAYPYVAGSTLLESGVFNPGWQERLGIGYGDIMWVATGERLTQETFEKYRKTGGTIISFTNTDEMIRKAVAHPIVMVASDGFLENGKGHPRGAGCFARILGHHVRELKDLSLMDALRKMTLMPAQRLEKMAPAMLAKGRVKTGADADLTLFDPGKVSDRATYEKPNLYSEGIPHVLVEGMFVVRDGELVGGIAPGQGIRAR